jgi:hypothetical protein
VRFARATVDCQTCHERDRMRTLGTAIDHQRLNFGSDCNNCHGSQSFATANFPGHDSCFEINRGPHAGLACRSCHSSLSVSSGGKSCSTQTAACSSCHTHSCSASGGQTSTDKKHAQVPGYQCKDRKCYECHRSP